MQQGNFTKQFLQSLNAPTSGRLYVADTREKGLSAYVIIGKSLGHKSQQATQIYARLNLDPVRESIEKATQAMMAAGKGIKTRKERAA